MRQYKKGGCDILIAHYLGVDHIGHRYSADHKEMQNILIEEDRLLKKTVEELDDDTLLITFSDHGMTSLGDHGGDSKEETEGMIWFYSKKGLLSEGREPEFESVSI